MHQLSKYDSKITEEYVKVTPENLYLERKEQRVNPGDIANELIGMLNSDGGLLIYGAKDNGELQDLSDIDDGSLEKYRTLHSRLIKPTPPIRLEEVYVEDKLIFLYHVREDNENIFSRENGNVYRRAGSSNYGPLSLDDITNLRYDKNLRHYEDQIATDFTQDDIDIGLLTSYAKMINFEGTIEELLLNRSLATKDKNGNIAFRNSAVLLFAKDPDKYIPSSYVRYVRYDGTEMETGSAFNAVKDITIRGNIPTIISKTIDLLKTAFGEFYSFDPNRATFTKVTEYPEEAWQEGIVNAVFHRSYNLQGNCTLIRHFDDKLEISNAGPLPAQVNVDNIRDRRFSRNPRIGRVLYEMGYVRELNEGVKRIYSSMNSYKLSEPEYMDEDSIVTLRLRNPIYKNERSMSMETLALLRQKLPGYNDTKRSIVAYLLENAHGIITDISQKTGIGERAIRKNLDQLVEDNIVIRLTDKIRDKNAQYVFKNEKAKIK